MTKEVTIRFRADAGDARALRQLSKRLRLPQSAVLRKIVHDAYASVLLDEAYSRKKRAKKGAKKAVSK